jgi:hypothetical protein
MMRKTFLPWLGLTVAIAAIVAGGCSGAKSDQALTTDIQARMFADPQVKSANVTVAVKNGEATLTGDVPDDGARLEAYKVAANTPGVKHVQDRMTVQAASADSQEASAAPPPPPEEAPTPAVEPEHKAKKRHETADRRTMDQNMEAQAGQPSADSNSDAAPQDANSAQPQPAAAPAPPPPPQPVQVEIPAGTSVRVQMIDSIDTAVNHAGDVFHASLASPIVVGSQVVVPKGTDVYVTLTNAKSAGHMTGQSELALELSRMDFQGKTYSLSSNDYTQTASSRSKRTAETVGGGAALGALLGAVLGRGKGAAIGAAVGAGGGAAAEAATKAQQVKIPSETKLDFQLQQPVDVSYFPGQNRWSRQ